MNKPDRKEDDTYSEAETERRREALLKNILSTPPKPLKDSKRSSGKSRNK